MFIELLDQLRCPADHEESPLVAAIDRMAGRYVERGSLGCSVCRSTYGVRDFVAHFGTAAALPVRQLQAFTSDDLTRLAALLDLRTPGGFVGLSGTWAQAAAPLALGYDVQCVVLDHTAGPVADDGVSVLLVADRIPLAPGSLRGIALDHGSIPSASAVRAVAAGGRVVGPASLAVPAGVEELARDQTSWVGERRVETLIALSRAR